MINNRKNNIFGRPDMTEEEFFASLNPDLTDKERHEQYINYYYNTDYSDLTVLTQMPDADDRMCALVESFDHTFSEHKDYCPDVGMDFVSVLPSGNIELVMVMLCGMGIHSLAKQAMIVRDEEHRFHSSREKVCLIVNWSNGETTTSDCFVDAATLRVYDYAEDVMQNLWDDGAVIEYVEVALQPIEDGEEYYFRCFRKDEMLPEFQNYSYWYTDDLNNTPAEDAA